MQLGSLRRQLTLLFGSLVVVQAIVLTLLYVRIKNVGDLHTELLQVDELRTELHGLRAAALDAETGQRGFVITGREEYLQPYRAAVLTFQPHVERLRRIVARKPDLRARAEALAAQLVLAQADMAHLVELRRRDGFAAAQQQILDGSQREAMNLLRTITLEIDDEAKNKGQAHERSYTRARSALIGLVFFCFCLGLLIICGLAAFMLTRLRLLTVNLGRPLVDVSRGLRAAAKEAARDATKLAEFAKTDADAKAEEQATLDVVSRMAKDLSTVAMEITSSVRLVAEGPQEGQPADYAAQVERIVALAGRIAQSALSLELTTAEQRRVLDDSGASLLQLEQSVKSVDLAAARVRKLSKDLVRLLQVFPGLIGKSAGGTVVPDGSEYEISPV